MKPFDHVLILGFGGPEKPQDILPFLENVTKGRRIPPERINEVAHHYELIGGRSPYNEYTFRLGHAIQTSLKSLGIKLPIYYGMRHSNPFLSDTLKKIESDGHQKGLLIVLAPYRSSASDGRYLEQLAVIQQEKGIKLEYKNLPPWFNHPLFIEAQSNRVREIGTDFNKAEPLLIFTNHSIPVSAARSSHYESEFMEASRQVACALKANRWLFAYQSRSGAPQDPWLEPDILTVLKYQKGQGVSSVLLVPISFLCDNAEVLYDLDIEAKRFAEKMNLRLERAKTVGDHPEFAKMWAELIQNEIQVLNS